MLAISLAAYGQTTTTHRFVGSTKHTVAGHPVRLLLSKLSGCLRDRLFPFGNHQDAIAGRQNHIGRWDKIAFTLSNHGNLQVAQRFRRQVTKAPAGMAKTTPDNEAKAKAVPITISGHKVYGVFVAPGTGYRNNTTNGIAKGDAAEGMYAIFDGTHYNSGCCFDYGNAETTGNDDGNGTMEAVYFGNSTGWGSGSGTGPWIMADLENGLFSGVNRGINAGDPTINHRFTTAIVKGGPNHWAIRGGNAQSGSLSTFYDGVRPNATGYNPMKKEGACCGRWKRRSRPRTWCTTSWLLPR